MAELDIRKLGVTLRSTSGTIAFANEIYDETQAKFQSAINADIYSKIGEAKGEAEASIQGVIANDKVLSVGTGDNATKIGSTLSLGYDSTNGKIQLKGIGDAVISEFSTADFTLKDKFVENAVLVETAEEGVSVDVPYIKITFNDESINPIRLSVKKLVDIYSGKNLLLGDDYGTNTSVPPAKGVSLDFAMSNVASRIATLEGTNYVNTFGGETGEITLKGDNTANGTINLALTDKVLTASIVGLKSAAYTDASDYATATQGGYADSALQGIDKGTEGDHVTLTIGEKTGENGAKKQTIGVSLTTKTLASQATQGASDGLATAKDVYDTIKEKEDATAESIGDLNERLETIEGTGEGSVAKALADAKDYADGLVSGKNVSAESTTANYIEASASNNKVSVGAKTSAVANGATGLATAQGVYNFACTCTVVGTTDYADWDNLFV